MYCISLLLYTDLVLNKPYSNFDFVLNFILLLRRLHENSRRIRAIYNMNFVRKTKTRCMKYDLWDFMEMGENPLCGFSSIGCVRVCVALKECACTAQNTLEIFSLQMKTKTLHSWWYFDGVRTHKWIETQMFTKFGADEESTTHFLFIYAHLQLIVFFFDRNVTARRWHSSKWVGTISPEASSNFILNWLRLWCESTFFRSAGNGHWPSINGTFQGQSIVLCSSDH